MTDNDLVINLNLLFIELEVSNNILSHSYYRCGCDTVMGFLDSAIDERLESLRNFHNNPEWLMQ